MQVPAGYANVQWVMLDSTNQHTYLTAIGVHLEAADLGAVATACGTAWSGNLAPFVGNEVTGLTTRVSLGTSNPSEPVVHEGPSFTAGSATGDTAPPNVALLVRKETAEGGRRNRGRMYIPKPTESGIDEAGNLSTGQWNAFGTAVESFQEDLEDIDGVTGLFLFHTAGAATPTAITNLRAMQMVATQRRRLRR